MSGLVSYIKVYSNTLLVRFFAKKESSLSERFMNNNLSRILIIVPHPDDEILGLGGFLIKSISKCHDIHIIYLTDGENSDIWPDKDEIRSARTRLSDKVCSKIGIPESNVYRIHFPDGNVPNSCQEGFNEIVDTIKGIIRLIKPDAVFVTHEDDYWPFDHVAAAHIVKEAVIQADTKPQLWYYWVWAWYNIRPWRLIGLKLNNLQKVDIRDQLENKTELANIYLNSFTPAGKPWSGILPEPLLKSFKYPFEIVQRIL